MEHSPTPIVCGIDGCGWSHTWPAAVARHRQAKHGVIAHGRSVVRSARQRGVTLTEVSWPASTGAELELLCALAEHWRMTPDDAAAELKRRAFLSVSRFPEVQRILAERRALERRAALRSLG